MENKNKQIKRELREILYYFQYSQDYGLCIGENLIDPRKENIDEYWLDTDYDSIGISELFKDLDDDPKNECNPLHEQSLKRFNLLSCMLKRISKRIDRLLL